MSENNNSRTRIIDFLGGIQLVFTILIGIGTYFNQQSLSELQQESLQIKNRQEEISFDREFKFKIYDLVIEAIKSNNPKQQQAAYITVDCMITNDTTLKSGLLGIFAKSETVAPNIRAAATVAKFDIKQSQVAAPVYSLSNKIHVDIFYYKKYEATTKVIAQKIYDALASSDFYELGPLKVLTENKNQDKWYNVKDNEIRFDDSEVAKALALEQIVNSILSDSGVSVKAQQTPNSNKPTRGYISLFIVKDNSSSFSDGFSDEFK